MSTIKISDLNGHQDVVGEEAAEVKGGPIYIKYEGIKGNVTAEGHVGGVNFAFGDGSVRTV